MASLDAIGALDWEGHDPPKPKRERERERERVPYRVRPRFKARPWWTDTSAVAQSRRAVKRWHGAANRLTLAYVHHRKRECRRLRSEGYSWREIGRLQGLHYTVARRHAMTVALDPWEQAMSSIMVERYVAQADVVSAEGVACQLTSKRKMSATRWWKHSPPVKYSDEWAHRARDGTWWIGPYRC